MKNRTLILALALCLAAPVKAQIFSHGTDPGHLRWYQMDTPHYRLLYPHGGDSLARVYGRYLEGLREATGRSSGMTPGAFQWRKQTSVVLHLYNGYSNGSMLYAPARMDLFTRPDPYGGDPSPWDLSLAAHEPRHLSQLQAGYRMGRPLGWLLGELWPSAVWSLYPSQALSEGDAVAVETALTPGARARTADFLQYFHIAFAREDWRNFYRWRYGSFKHYTPDYYKVGYMTVAGTRVFYDDPLFMKEYFDHIIAHPFSLGNMQKTIRKASGKSFKESFREIEGRFAALWEEEAARRAPFMPMEQLTQESAFPVDYSGGVGTPEGIFLLRSGYVHAKELVLRTPDGKIRRVRPFAAETSRLVYSAALDRIFWSETVSDLRWSLSHTSRIRYMDRQSRKVHDLTREGRLYNPQPSEDGLRLAAVEYPYEGGSRVVILSGEDGTLLERFPSPDGVQATGAAWFDGNLYAIGVSMGGSALYSLPSWEAVIPPSIQKMVHLTTGREGVEYVSDRTGVNEWYVYTPETGVRQRSRTRGGATDFISLGDTLFFSAQTPTGMKLFRIPLNAVSSEEIQPLQVHTWVVEDALRLQEEALGDGSLYDGGDPSVLSAPKPYRRLLHPGRIHSWAPIYFRYDALSSLSLDLRYETLSPGVTGLFQNDLGNSSGVVGYSAHPDPVSGKPWRHSLHGQWTYTGRWPVIDASFDWNDAVCGEYHILGQRSGNLAVGRMTYQRLSTPRLTGQVALWVPLNFSRGGILSGLVPKLSWSFSNDRVDTRRISLETAEGLSGIPEVNFFRGIASGRQLPLQRLSASVRGYAMLAQGSSQTYPRWGIGAEVGGGFRPALTAYFRPNLYGYLYGYLPGFVREQGLRLTGMVQQQLGASSWFAEPYANTLPRGFSSSFSSFFTANRTQWKVTADYALPIYAGDISVFSPVLYIKNFLLIPHVDLAGGKQPLLVSAGAALTAQLANLVWVPFDTSIGLRASWLGGPLYREVRTSSASLAGKPWSLELIFSVDI